ncbi:MAG: hypothetical protein ACM3X5_00425 [Bacillota bacterium]
MKCRIGDVAMVVRPLVKSNWGMLVEVKAACDDKPGWWWVRSLSGPRQREDGTVEPEGAVHDSRLSPMRKSKPKRRKQQSDRRMGSLI